VKGIIRKGVFSITVAAVLAFIVVNGYFAVQNLHTIKENVGIGQETTQLQAELSGVLLTLATLETGQQGYLLTEDPSYLQLYTSALEQLPRQFSKLHTILADRPADERLLESQLESVAQAKISEADESIRLRQQGYRSRAFRIVKSNRGKELMDQARAHSASLLATEASRFADYEQSTKASMSKAFSETIGWNSLLLLSTALVFALLWFFGRGLEAEVVRGSNALREKTAQLESFTQTVSQDLPELLSKTQASLDDFLNEFADYLPARGQEHATQIQDMAAQSNRLMSRMLHGEAVSNAA
jgi:CHASE3 domain sensor protein